MKLLLRVSAFTWLLSHVNAQGGKPETIITFEPLTDVRDQARIDLDQLLIRELAEAYDFETAEKVYQEGSYSKSVSNVTLSAALTIDIAQGANLTGTNEAGDPVAVFAQAQNYTSGAMYLAVQYRDEGCYVGANPEPVLTGCLAPNGTLTDEASGTSISYSYDPKSSYNVYSIQYFTQGTEFIFENGGDYTVDFQKFVDYYGSPTYADGIITAALQQKATSFTNGNIDGTLLGDKGRAQITKKGTAYIAVMMYVLRELEHAIYLCETGDCEEESCLGKAAVHEVDEAVAFYAGSLASDDNPGELMYALAEDKAIEFAIADTSVTSGPAAKVNMDIMKVFDSAKEHIVAADCAGLRTDTTEISRLMTIPLVQGFLKYASLTRAGIDKDADWEDHTAERVVFAASILPYVHSCSEEDAKTIYDNANLGSTSVDFEAVETAMKNVYPCLNITETDIGTVPGGDDSGDNGGGGGTEAPDGEGSGATMAGLVLGMIPLLFGLF